MIDPSVDGYRWIITFREFKNYLFFDIIDLNRRGKKILFDKSSNSGYCIPGSLTYMNWGYLDDISGGPLFSIQTKVSTDEVACVFEVIELKEFKAKGLIDPERSKDPKRYNELVELIESSNIEDNPIIAIAKLK